MNELETALKNHNWSLDGYTTRPGIDQLIKENSDTGQELWEQYCPWSATNGGYIKWRSAVPILPKSL
ncbi:MAG: hypothetical protein EBU08_14465 [Micrococcales bacterium]|nr:hypothetical protein [Micrococcales bacterium]